MLDDARINVEDEARLIAARRVELGLFLRARRARLQPGEIGFAHSGRRHVRGLRRDEVAALADIGVTWYTMLEQGRVENASPRTLNAVARALRLSAPERAHLFALAARSFEELNLDPTAPPAALTRFIERTTLGMAFIVSPRFDVVAFNSSADRFFRFSAQPQPPNILRLMFSDPAMRGRFISPRWEEVAAQMVGHFRSWHGRVGGSSFDALVAELQRFAEFAALWEARSVMSAPAERSLVALPGVAPFTVNVMAFTSFVCPTHTIIFKTPAQPQLRPEEAAPAAGMVDHHRLPVRFEARRRTDLGAFLRQRRERTLPQDVGLTVSGRRHAKGLRREEVAGRAGIGVSWYTMLEQGRVENVTHRTLRAVADALGLSHRERLYLEQLAAQSFAEFAGLDGAAGADLLQLARSFPDGHAHFHDSRFDMLAWNADADDFYGFSELQQPNLLQIMVRNVRLRSQFIAPSWQEALARMLSHYRFTHALLEDSRSEEMIAGLMSESREFADIWLRERTVLNPATELGQLSYPRTGRRAVNVLLLAPTTLPTHTLVLKVRADG